MRYFIQNLGRRLKKSQVCNLFTTCDKTPLYVFRSCLIERELKALVISGKCSEELLTQTWENIWFEYCDLLGERQYRRIFDTLKEINYQKNRLTALELAIIAIENGQTSKEIEQVMLSNGYNPKQLELAKKRIKSINITVEQLIKELAELRENEETEESSTHRMKENFTDSVLMLQKHGFVIDLNKTTVFEYARMKKQYNEEIEYYKQLSNGKGKN